MAIYEGHSFICICPSQDFVICGAEWEILLQRLSSPTLSHVVQQKPIRRLQLTQICSGLARPSCDKFYTLNLSSYPVCRGRHMKRYEVILYSKGLGGGKGHLIASKLLLKCISPIGWVFSHLFWSAFPEVIFAFKIQTRIQRGPDIGLAAPQHILWKA